MNYTKGEWIIDEQKEGCSISIYSDQRPEAFVTVWSETNREDDLKHMEAKANAKLIAAAPDLLRALKKLVGIEAWINDRKMTELFQNTVYPAIEKATE